jgi:hypothetical protein
MDCLSLLIIVGWLVKINVFVHNQSLDGKQNLKKRALLRDSLLVGISTPSIKQG